MLVSVAEADRTSVTKRANTALDDCFGAGSSKAFRALQRPNLCWPRLIGAGIEKYDGPQAAFPIRDYGPTVALEIGKIMTDKNMTEDEKNKTNVYVTNDDRGQNRKNVVTVKTILDDMESNAGALAPLPQFDYENAENWEDKEQEETGKLFDGSTMVFT